VIANLTTGSWTRATRILPIGDSLTYGVSPSDNGSNNSAEGYREPLWQSFSSQGMLIDFVGDRQAGSTLPDQDHSGYPGARSDAVKAALPGLMDSQRPDAILLLAGTNDVYQLGAEADEAVAVNLGTMINTVAAKNPAAHLYVATILPVSPLFADPAEREVVNSVIRSIVQQAIAEGKRVHLVDTSDIGTSDLYDGTHPTTAGYSKLAQDWFSVITAAQPNAGGTPGGTPTAILSSVINVIGGDANDLLIGDTRDNLLQGGLGKDLLQGGLGRDTFRYGVVAEGSDTIADFAHNTDVLQFSASGFAGLTAGMNLGTTGRFVANANGTASSASGIGQLVYNTTSGVLSWDNNGSASGGVTDIALLTGHPTLTASDLAIIA
jgi:lysophospholipase L1-like esterase